jgi:starch synthase
MKILLASSEVYPYSKTGGLADMVAALAKALGRAGHQVGLATPLYGSIWKRFPDIEQFDWHMDLPMGATRVTADVWTLQPSKNVTVYFINQPQFYDRAGLYNENGIDYPDNGERFIFFSKAAVHLARYLPWAPEIIHVHDWQTGLVPILALHHRLTQGWPNPPRTCLTIHNLAYQGVFPRRYYDLTNLPVDYFNPNGVEFYGYMNCMKAAIMYADTLTTVSPRYAREITTEEFGCGLDDRLRQRQDSIFGILNGVDYDEWKTENNPHLKHNYSAADLTGKFSNKLDLQLELGLPKNLRVPLFGSITRLVDQKGVDLLLGALEEMLSASMQFVMLGSGAPVYEKAFTQLAARHPNKVAVRIGYDHGLSHRIEAGSDFFLMPSRYEPSGLNQMYSLRYATIPIVRTTGGLDDSITDISVDLHEANGIKFTEYSVRALAKAIRKALVLYEHPGLMQHYQKNAMSADFSWAKTAAEYLKVYRRN